MTVVVGTTKYRDIEVEEGIASFGLWEQDSFVGYVAIPLNELDEIIS